MPELNERFRQVLDADMIGQVKHIDFANHRVRCAFKVADDTSPTGIRLIISGWLPVLCTTPAIPVAGSGQTEPGGDPVHTHGLTVNGWFPQLNDIVVVRFLPAQNGDGYVIGGLTWH